MKRGKKHSRVMWCPFELSLLQPTKSSKRTSQSPGFRTFILATNKKLKTYISKPWLSNSHSCNQHKAQNSHLKALAFELSFLQPTKGSKRTSQSLGFRTFILATNKKLKTHISKPWLSNSHSCNQQNAQNVHLKAPAFELSFLQPTKSSKRTSQSPGFRTLILASNRTLKTCISKPWLRNFHRQSDKNKGQKRHRHVTQSDERKWPF